MRNSSAHAPQGTQLDLRLLLRKELLNRCRGNPGYSLRAFARALEIDYTTLSKLISGRRGIGKRVLKRLAPRLGLTGAEVDRLIVARALRVEFTSIGSGIDSAAQEKVLAFAVEAAKEARLSKLAVTPWGREGERTLCFEFFDWQYARNTAEAAVKNAIQGGTRPTSYTVVLNCQ